jgi:uncharacterized surface protein with fasciclin (FAS1) repeats
MMNRTLATLALYALAACSGKGRDDAAVRVDSAAPAAAPAPSDAALAPKDIIETAAVAGTFNTLTKALTDAGLIETLKGSGPYTVLAPSDEAFAKLPKKELDALLADKAKLTRLLKYHVLSGNVTSTQVATMTEATTLEGGKLAIAVVNGKVTLNGKSTVTSPDISASNGTIHVIDAVLMPPKK